MWKCPNCSESVEDTFDACWNCGATPDGALDPHFQREPDDPAIPDPGDESESAPAAASAPRDGMTRHEIASLVCKTVSLFMFGSAATLSVATFPIFIALFKPVPYNEGFDWSDLLLSLTLSSPFFATVIVGLVYWKKSDAIASHMVSSDPGPVTLQSITVRDVMTIAFSILGIFFLLGGIRELISVVHDVSIEGFPLSELWRIWRVWSALIQLLAAAWLMLGSRGTAKVLLWLQTDDIAEADDSETGDTT